jgi:S1-C subfamily serine protease
MKRFSKILAVLLILSVIPVSAATYQLVTANYPINVNGVKLAVQPLNYNGTTYLPLRSISEAVGVPIEWNSAKKSVEITTLDLDRLKEASVMIYADDGKTQVQGSGVYTDYGEVTSAFHLIADNRTNLKTSEGDKLTVDDTDQPLDIMTLDSSDDIKPVKIGDSDEVKVGDKVIVVGAPDGKNDSIIYARVKQITNEIVIDVAVNGGGSGGALFTIDGQFIGTLVAADFGLKETYVTPINSIRKAL